MVERKGCRAAFVVGVTLAAGMVLGIACVNPRDQYDDYLSRTADARGPARGDAAGIETSALDGGFSSVYVATCLPHITTPDRALRFQVQVEFVPNADGTPGGDVTMTFIPLRAMTTRGDDTVGNPVGPVTSHMGADQRFDLVLMNLFIPAAANPISPNDAVFEMVTHLPGTFLSEQKFCGGLDGTITEPLQLTLTHCVDVCLFDQLPMPSAPLPTYTERAQFVCPAPDC